MASIYKARWNKAVQFIMKINDYIDKGYLVFDEKGNRVRRKFEIRKDSNDKEEIIVDDSDFNIIRGYFTNDPNFDNGILETHEQWIKDHVFDEWTVTKTPIVLENIYNGK